MSTAEKLLVQIFDRKNSIIEQVKRQTELFNQHLASKLLIDGITPPPWLFEPDSYSDANEVNKEQLISKLLCPQYPRSSARGASSASYTVYRKPVVAGHKEDLSDRAFADNVAFNRGLDTQDGLSVPTMCTDQHDGVAVYAVPEISVTSPEVNMLNAEDHSIAGMHGSEVIRHAIELRKSAKTESKKSSLFHEKSNKRASSEMRFSPSAANHAHKEDEFQRVKPVRNPTVQDESSSPIINCDHHAGSAQNAASEEDINMKSAEDQTGERIGTILNASYQSVSGLQRSKSRQKALELRNSSKKIAKSSSGHDKITDQVSSEIMLSLSVSNQSGQENELQRLKEDCSIGGEILNNSCLEAAEFQNQEKEMDTSGRTSCYVSHHRLPDIVTGSPTHTHNSDSRKVDFFSDFDTLMKKDSTNTPDPEKVFVCSNLDRVNSEAQESMSTYDKSHQENHTSASLSSNLHNHACIDKPYESSPMDHGTKVAQNEILELHVHDSDMEPAVVVSSLGLQKRETRITPSSPKRRSLPVISNGITSLDDTMFEMDHSTKAGVDEGLQNALSDQFFNSFHGIRDSVDEHGTVGYVTANELGKSYDRDPCGTPCSNSTEHKNELEIPVARNPPESFVVVGIHHSNFDKNGEPEFEYTSSDFGNRSLNGSLEKASPLTCSETSGGFTGQESQAGQCGEMNEKISFESNFSGNNDSRSMNESRLESHGSFIVKLQTRISSEGVDQIKPLSQDNIKLSACPKGIVYDKIAVPTMDEKDAASGTCWDLHGDNSSLEGISRRASMDLQPPLKMSNIEHGKGQSMSNPPSFWGEIPHNLQRSSLTSIENNGNLLIDACESSKGVDIEFCQEMDNGVPEAVGSTFPFRDKEVGVGICHDDTENIQLRMVSSFANEKGNSQRCLIERVGRLSSSCKSDDNINASDGQNSENLTLTSWITEVQSLKNEDGPKTHDSIISSSRREKLEFTDIDESMPVFEGFSVGSETSSFILDHISGGIDFDKLNSSSSNIERASILAELCRSACLDTPLARFSSSAESQETKNICSSTCSVQLDQSFRNPLPPIDADEQLPPPTTLTDHLSNSIKHMPYCDFPPYSGSQYGLDLGSKHPSPIGKLKARLSSYSGSSGKRFGSSSNPDLMCFPIEEDPTTSEDDDAAFGNANDADRDTNPSMVKNCENSHPLQDLTNLGSNPLQPVSEEEKAFRVDEVFRAKPSAIRPQDEALGNPRYGKRNKNVSREKETSSVVANGGRNNLVSSVGISQIKIKESSTSSLGQMNNIISNVTSFIPLIKQKQAAAAAPGKKDVKVKALEAAEAAKRFEEKKQKEREMRKEALKLERAKLEEKRLISMELDKRRKEAERKKKDADKIARKRMREEDERKEKEKKKLRVERRRLPRELEEKARSEKSEDEKQQLKDWKANKKGMDIVSGKSQKIETTRDDLAMRKTETKLTADKVAGEVVEGSPHTENMLPHNSKEQSYDISPYQCSDDDEEDDDDDFPTTKKHVPSWASKSSVARHLPLQLEMDPDMIFPRGSFCSIDEGIH